jgi:hypothetical protein
MDSERTARLQKGKAGDGKPSYAQQVRAPPPVAALPPVAAAQQRNGGWQVAGKGRGGPGGEKIPLAPIKGSIPMDERVIIFERTQDAPQLDWVTVNQIASHVNNTLGRVAPAHIRTEKFRVSQRGMLSTTARQGASAAMLLYFKKELIEAARKGDDRIVNVRSNESWTELKILVPYAVYRDNDGIGLLREEIEAGNPGVLVPPFSIRWIRPKEVIEEIWEKGSLPANKASVVFKVPGKEVARQLQQEIWVN